MQLDEGILHLGSRNLSEYTFSCDTSHPDCCFLIIGLGSMRTYSLINVAKCLLILSMGLPAPPPNINLIRESIKRQSKCDLFSYTFLQTPRADRPNDIDTLCPSYSLPTATPAGSPATHCSLCVTYNNLCWKLMTQNAPRKIDKQVSVMRGSPGQKSGP